MTSDAEILKQFADVIVPALQSVSKRFAPSIESEITETSLTIYASPYITTLIDGRRPTSSNARAGTPNLQKILLEWIKTKSITPYANKSGKIPSLESLSFAMSKSMHKKGDLLFQRGGGNNIFEPILTNERIENLLNLFGEKYLIEIQNINIK
jgi:hypothetical protein